MGNLAQPASLSENPTRVAAREYSWWQIAILAVLVAWLYSSIFIRLVQQWLDDPSFSHGFLVIPFSLLMVWRSRSQFWRERRDPSSWGLAVVGFALAVLSVGVLGAELFLSRISFLFLVAGMVIYFEGWSRFRTILFPWAFLIFMIPIPTIVLNEITFPLQLLAAKTAGLILHVLDIPVLREGNIIHLPTTSLDVAEACSGIRSLLSLATLSVIYGYLLEPRIAIRLLLALSSVPVAVLVNSLRIVGTGLLVQYWDQDRALGFLHTFAGWLVFLMSVGALFSLHEALRLISRRPRREQ